MHQHDYIYDKNVDSAWRTSLPQEPPVASLAQWATDFQHAHMQSSQMQRMDHLKAENRRKHWHIDFLSHTNPSQSMNQQFGVRRSNAQPHTTNSTAGMATTQTQLAHHRHHMPSALSLFAAQQHSREEAFQQEQQDHQYVPEDAADTAAFDRAFDKALQDDMRHLEEDLAKLHSHDRVEVSKQEEGKGRNIYDSSGLSKDVEEAVRPEVDHIDAPDDILNQGIRPEGDQMDVEEPVAAEAEAEADALSRTAGRLLDSVANETSDKFRQSQFLGLMRKLRDGEVRIEGEEMVDVAAT